MKPLFCNKCHKRVLPPSFIKGSNIKAENAIKIKCGDANCSGYVKYKVN